MSPAGWRVDDHSGLRVIRCEALEQISGLVHAFSTRHGNGTDRFDLGSHATSDVEIDKRREHFCDAAGFSSQRPTILHQVHGATVLDAADVIQADSPREADGVVAATAGAALPAVRWADCVPVLIAERGAGAVAAVHAGWRGIVAGVVAVAVRRLCELGIRPADLCAALGPAIGSCCYEVGGDVLAAVSRASGVELEAPTPRAGMLDLRRALGLQLERCGLARGAVHVAPWCTRCRGDLFFSYRREGPGSGRQMACIGWRSSS